MEANSGGVLWFSQKMTDWLGSTDSKRKAQLNCYSAPLRVRVSPA